MNLENIFKNVIKIEILFLVIIVIVYSYVDVEYAKSYTSSTMEENLYLWGLVWLVVYAVNLYFLYKFKPIGKTLYLPLLILGFILFTLYPAQKYTELDLTIEWISGVINGLVIALLYFTDIKDKFIKK